MKNIKQFILEGRKREFSTTVKEFFQWYIGDDDLKKLDDQTLEDCALDFLEDDFGMNLKEIADFINKHWNDKLNLSQTDIGNCLETNFTIGDKDFNIDSSEWYD